MNAVSFFSLPQVGAFRCLTAGLLAGLLLTASQIATAQDPRTSVTRAIEQEKSAQPRLTATIDPRTGLPTRLKGLSMPANPAVSLGAGAAPPTEADVRQAVHAFFATAFLQSAFPEAHPSTTRVISAVRPDPTMPGHFVADVRQEVAGIPVFGSSAKVEVNPTLSVTGLPVPRRPTSRTRWPRSPRQTRSQRLARG